MKFLNYLFLLWAVLFYCNPTDAQTLLNSDNKTAYTYIYKLDNPSALEILKSNQIQDSAKYFTQLVDSFLTTQPKDFQERLKPGQYLLVHAENRNLNYRLLSISNLVVKASGLNSTNHIYVYDLQGNPITKGVELFTKDGVVIKRDEMYSCWSINNASSYTQYFYIVKDSVLSYYQLKRNYVAPVKSPKKSKSYTKILPGYFVLNQPLYKKNDSLILKAFLLKRNGKPYNKKVILKIWDSRRRKMALIKELKPISRGAYTYAFQIPDSFGLDQNYTIYLMGKRRGVLQQKNFRVEQYSLKNATFEARMEKSLFYKGEAIFFHLKSFDANNLPMADTKIKLNIKIANILDYFDDSLFVPLRWQTVSYWKKELFADPSGNTEIQIPDSLFFNARITFNAQIQFLNADGEAANRNFTFNYNPQSNRYLFYQDGDSIRAIYLKNSISTKKNVRLISYNKRVLETKEIQLPYAFAVEEFPQYYQLKAGDTLLATVNPKASGLAGIRFEGYRTYDSLKLKLINDPALPVSYWIYQKSKLIEKGKSRKLNLHQPLQGGHSVDVVYSYRIGGELYTFVQSFHHQEKSLHVESDIPKKIYPGQELVVKMQVKNHKGKLKRNVNLTAFAINGKMQGIEKPNMPYFGKKKNASFFSFKPNLSQPNIYRAKTLNLALVEYLKLRKIPYYHFIYSKTGFELVYDSIEAHECEFSPYIVKDGYVLNISEVYIDEQLEYFSKSYFRQPYSLRVEAGTHKVVLRTSDGFLTIQNVKFKKGFKLFLSIEKDSIPKFKNMEFVKVDSKYLGPEKDKIANNLLVTYTRMKKPFYLVQGNHIYHSNRYGRYGYRNGYLVVGPIKPGKVLMITQDFDSVEFFFQKGYIYKITDSTVTSNQYYAKNIIAKLLVSVKNGYMGFNAHERPLKIPAYQKKKTIVVKQRPRPNPYLKNYDRSGYLKQYGQLYVKLLMPMNVLKTWLINWEDSVNSKFYTYKMTSFGRLKPGEYQLIYLLKDSSYVTTKLQTLGNGSNYRIYDSLQIRPYDNAFLHRIENLVIHLNTPKPREFKNFPKVISNYKSKSYPVKNEMNFFTGTILDSLLNPVPNAIVLLERNGVFAYGAYTNAAGSFVIQENISGNYQIKIFVHQRFYNYYNTFLAKNLANHVDIILPEILYPNRYLSPVEYDRVTETDEASYSYSAASPINYESAGSVNYVTTEGVQIAAAKSVIKRLNVGRIPAMFGDVDLKRKKVDKDKSNPGPQHEFNGSKEERKRFEDMIQDTRANRIRSHFRDYAFFIPNLITNRKGEAYFTAKFPDNQTLWKTYFPAVNYHKNTGLLEVDIQAYKPLSASIALPKFLIQGDVCLVKGKISNYMGEAYNLTPWFKIGNDSISLPTTAPKHFEVFPKNISFKNLGVDTITFGFRTQQAYVDAERRNIPVLVNGIEVSHSQHFYAKNNFTISLKADTNLVSRTLFITNNQLDVLTKEIDYLKHYAYGCNEQNASKIKALLAEKSIKDALDLPFENEKILRTILRKLEKTQNNNGSWGWWNKGDRSEVWMTIYIVDALHKAALAGYSSRAISPALNYLENSLDNMKIGDKLYALDVLLNYKSARKFKPLILRLDSLNLNTMNHFRLIRIQQKAKIPYNIQDVVQASSKSPKGIYWGENVMDFKVNITQTSSLAYEILKHDPSSHQTMLEETRHYFLTHLSKNRNTIERAVLLQNITDDIIARNSIKKEIRSELIINGKTMPQQYPLSMTFKNTEPIYIEKTGAPLQLSIYETSIQNPTKRVDTLFSCQSIFYKSGDTISSVQLADAFQYRIAFQLKKAAEFVMLEVPIPAGTEVNKKNYRRLPYETYRMYQDDKVILFFRKLSRGNHYLTLPLKARFAGNFHVVSAKISLMYFPDVFGFSSPKQIQIKE